MLAVKTPVFEGPLDLLLHLIEREDLDVTAVSLIQVTDQYMAALRSGDQIDLRAMADFVAVGARLLLLKSRALLPRSADQLTEDDLEAQEIADDLTAQLEEYRAFKDAASYLRELEQGGHRSYVREAPLPFDYLPTGLERVTMNRLLKALSRALQRLPVQPEPERLQRAMINVAERRHSILQTLRIRGRISFERLISGCRSRLEAIITFFAILDLMKTEDLIAEQDSCFGEIVLQAREHSPDHSPTAAVTA